MLQPSVMTLAGMAAQIAARQISPPELVKDRLRSVDAMNGCLQAFNVIAAEHALAQAQRAELGFEWEPNSAEQFRTDVASEVARWGKALKDTGVRAD